MASQIPTSISQLRLLVKRARAGLQRPQRKYFLRYPRVWSTVRRQFHVSSPTKIFKNVFLDNSAQDPLPESHGSLRLVEIRCLSLSGKPRAFNPLLANPVVNDCNSRYLPGQQSCSYACPKQRTYRLDREYIEDKSPNFFPW